MHILLIVQSVSSGFEWNFQLWLTRRITRRTRIQDFGGYRMLIVALLRNWKYFISVIELEYFPNVPVEIEMHHLEKLQLER